MDILTQIVDYKKTVISNAKNALPISDMQTYGKSRGFLQNIENKLKNNQTAIIAEIKKGSPSRGIIVENLDVASISKQYETGGSACISVLTDEKFFHGNNNNIKIAKESCRLPILRKDFIIDPYQIHEAKHIGADAILLIASILTGQQIQEFEEIASNLGLDVLAETHTMSELETVLKWAKTPLIGINNRNLKNFEISLQNTIDLIKLIPAGKIAICESGIENKEDIALIQTHKCNAFLIGTSIMQKENKAEFIQKLLQ